MATLTTLTLGNFFVVMLLGVFFAVFLSMGALFRITAVKGKQWVHVAFSLRKTTFLCGLVGSVGLVLLGVGAYFNLHMGLVLMLLLATVWFGERKWMQKNAT